MVVIRLARHGRHKYPTYRIVAADKRRAATSKFLAILGTYNPHTKELNLKKDEITAYLKNGAQASDRVLRLLQSQDVELPKWAKTHDRNKSPKSEPKEEETTEVEGPAEEATVEVASETAEKAEEKAQEVKDDTGTVKEAEQKAEGDKKTEKVAEAVEETVEQETKKEA
jgi:small subunit ribosomal protein S16